MYMRQYLIKDKASTCVDWILSTRMEDKAIVSWFQYISVDQSHGLGYNHLSQGVAYGLGGGL